MYCSNIYGLLSLNCIFFLFHNDLILVVLFYFLNLACVCVLFLFADDLVAEKDKSRMLQADMEATLQDIQNM